jgi:hypothetical protein
MSLDKLAETVGEKTDRSGFLRRMGVATIGTAFAFLGLKVQSAAAYTWKCCGLCQAPTSCSPVCSWCWWCCDSTNHKWNCCEGYSSSANGCGSNGDQCGAYFLCSFTSFAGFPCVS